MIIDVDQAEALPAAGHYDVGIAGGGVAGIVLAKALAERGRRVALLEAGGLDYSEESQNIYQGRSIGRPYFDLDTTRLRYLGGTSNHWAGWCRPLDAYDFAGHAHIADSSWPIGIEALQPYLAEALQICEIDAFPDDVDLPTADRHLKEIFFRFSPRIGFGDKYLDYLQSKQGLDLYLNANLIKMNLDPGNDRIAEFVFRGYRDNAPEQTVTADTYVLAMGGIENARALLNANHQRSAGLGNESDLVGRFFMEHPHHFIGHYVASSAHPDFNKNYHFFSPTSEMIDQAKIANCGLRFEPVPEVPEKGLMAHAKGLAKDLLCASDIIADFARSVAYFYCPLPTDAGRLRAASEQVPNRNSRIQLIDERDGFGQRRVALDWHLSPIDKTTMRSVALAAGRYMAEQNIGRVKLYDWLLAEDDVVPGLSEKQELAGFHHIGTTRMGASSDDGVVDLNCRLFGVDNLYIAGSSVFRTGGHANPTLTIVQLTLRLADHLARG